MRNARRIDENISIGLVPDGEDLQQLCDLGYRTVVDVREEHEKFGGQVSKRAGELGLDYVSIPISREELRLDQVFDFYRIVYDEKNAPLYLFSRFGKKPLAFVLLFEATARGDRLTRIYQRASRIGIDLRGDPTLESFLVSLLNQDHSHEILDVIREIRPELLHPGTAESAERSARVGKTDHLVTYVQRPEREDMLGQRGCTVWLTGLPAAGKSSIAFALERELVSNRNTAYVLDSDNIRHGLAEDLGFTAAERSENIRRACQVAKLFADAGLIVIASFISPFCADRELARQIHVEAALGFVEVYVDTPRDLCEQRDTRGLYRSARAGGIPGFTGVGGRYEPPSQPELIVKPESDAPTEIAQQVLAYLLRQRFVSRMTR